MMVTWRELKKGKIIKKSDSKLIIMKRDAIGRARYYEVDKSNSKYKNFKSIGKKDIQK